MDVLPVAPGIDGHNCVTSLCRVRRESAKYPPLAPDINTSCILSHARTLLPPICVCRLPSIQYTLVCPAVCLLYVRSACSLNAVIFAS